MKTSLRQDATGAATVEFALVAPLLLAFIFGIMEAALALWTWQVAQETVYATARCVAIDDVQCNSDAKARQFSVNRMEAAGITMPTSAFRIERNVTCNGMNKMDRVIVTFPYRGLSGVGLPLILDTVNSDACMPDISSS